MTHTATLSAARMHLPVESQSRMEHSVAYRDVLAWATEDSDALFSVDGLSGVTDVQSAHLRRLSALILRRIGGIPDYANIALALAEAENVAVPRDVDEAFGDLAASDPLVNLSALYASIVSASNRRTLGTFFTPTGEAMSMVEEYARTQPQPASVVDVGAGVGVFSAAARTLWASATIEAVDINPVTLGLQAVALLALDDESTTVVLSDYSTWLATRRPDMPTLYLGNPPYTRWQLIPSVDREALLEATGELVTSRANLSTIFLAMTVMKLRPEDGLSLIVPAGWLSASYAKRLRAYVRAQVTRPVNLRLADSWRFEGAIVDAVVVQIGPVNGDLNPLTVTDWPGVSTTELSRDPSDESPLRRFDIRSRPAGTRCGTPLSEFGRASRGVATGANSFFVRSSADPSHDDVVDGRWLTEIVRRIRPGTTPEEPAVETAALLTLRDYRSGDDAAVDLLIARAVEAGIDKGHLCSLRTRWFDLSSEVWIPDVIFSSLGRDAYHFHVNSAKRAITNNLFGWTWNEDVSGDEREEILSWFRSVAGQRALHDSSVREANGLYRLSPRALMSVMCPVERPRRHLPLV